MKSGWVYCIENELYRITIELRFSSLIALWHKLLPPELHLTGHAKLSCSILIIWLINCIVYWSFPIRLLWFTWITLLIEFSPLVVKIFSPSKYRRLWSGSLINLHGSGPKEEITYFQFIILGLSSLFADIWRTRFGCYQIWTPQGTGEYLIKGAIVSKSLK